MDKKILASIAVIAIVAALVGAGTMAYFSDIEVSSGNVFQAGTIDLGVNGINDPAAIVTLTGLKPCEWAYVEAILHVWGNEADVYFHIANVVDDGGIESEPERKADPTGLINDISNHITFDLRIDSVVIIDPADEMKIGWIECVWFYLGNFAESIDYTLTMSFHLQDVGNEYQGDKCTFDLEFIAIQKGTTLRDHGIEENKILLENKDPTTWDPIKGDGIWGVCGFETSTLTMDVKAKGLAASTDFQLSINSPEKVAWYPVDDDTRKAMASALASDSYDSAGGSAPPSGWNIYERGYYDISAGGYLISGTPTWQDDLIGTYVIGTADGEYDTDPCTTDANGEMDETKTAVLPAGQYSYIKCVIKYDTSPWTAVLMEERTPMFFTIP